MRHARGAIKLSHIIELAILAIAVAGTWFVVRKYRQPGQMSVLEAQGMDMSAMKPPEGVVPVATEIVQPGPLEGAVSYSGSVVAFTDEDVYPRVTGRIISLPVYPGDRVRPGQKVVSLDKLELNSRAQEAFYGQQKARQGVITRQADYAQRLAMSRQAQAEIAAAQGAVQEARHDVNAASGMVKQARAEIEASQQAARAMQREQQMAEEERAVAEANAANAQAMLPEAQAELTSMSADLEYWEAEFKREQVLLKQGVIAQEEFDSEKARYLAARAKVDQAKAKISQVQANLKSAQAAVRSARARSEAASARYNQSESEIAVAMAKQDQAAAGLAAAQERVRQRQADADKARASLSAAEASVRAASSSTREAAADSAQAGQMLTTANIVRGYADIRASVHGVVTARLVSPGVLVQPGTPILRLAQIDSVRLQANVAQSDLASIKVGAPVTARDMNRKVIAQARVTSVFPSADPTARTSIVEALVPNPGYKMLPGQYITLEIGQGHHDDVLSVPTSCLVQSTGQTQGPASGVSYGVWIAQAAKAAAGKTIYTCTMHPEVRQDHPGNCPKCGMALVPEKATGTKTAHFVAVTQGLSNGQRTEILNGLSAGTEVIVQGGTYLREGDAIWPTAWSATGPKELPPPPGQTGSSQGQGETMPGMKM